MSKLPPPMHIWPETLLLYWSEAPLCCNLSLGAAGDRPKTSFPLRPAGGCLWALLVSDLWIKLEERISWFTANLFRLPINWECFSYRPISSSYAWCGSIWTYYTALYGSLTCELIWIEIASRQNSWSWETLNHHPNNSIHCITIKLLIYIPRLC